MPLFQLHLAAETEGVVAISAARPRNWGLKVVCDNCREFSPRFIYVDEGEEQQSGGGGTRNAVFHCAFCKSVISVSVDPDSYGKFEPDGDDVIVAFDVRGGAPEELELDSQWVVEAEGSSFANADLSSDWMDYDQASGNPVSVMGLSVSFCRAKKKK